MHPVFIEEVAILPNMPRASLFTLLLVSAHILPASASPGAAPPAATPVSILTEHNDNQRTGANLQERILNTANVNVNNFGKLFARPVDGQIYAQPLYLPHIKFPGQGIHDVVYVATEHNSVYAFDADDPKASTPLWHVNFGPSAPTPNNDFGNDPRWGPYHDLTPEVGITSTPVINLANRTIYVVSFTKQGPMHYKQTLHALDLVTGKEKLGGPVNITATVPGTGEQSVNGKVTFDPMQHLQRPALLLLNGMVYLGFGSHADAGLYHGWLMAYDANTLRQVSVFCTTPNGAEGSIWQSGQGPSADGDGNIYVETGNGTGDVRTGGSGYGECVIKFKPTKTGLTVLDWFMPHDADSLNAGDAEIGSSGILLIPGTDRLVAGSKQGFLYLLKRSSLGHFHPNDDSQAVQSFQAAVGNIHGSPVYWVSPKDGPLVYVWSEQDALKAFKLVNGQFLTTPQAASPEPLGGGMPGGILSLSADGSKPGTGILWATHPVSGDANPETRPGLFCAFDASDVSKELWNSLQNPTRDDVGNFAKFCPPTIANGKVYLGTFSGQLLVYGLLPKTGSAPVPPPH